MLELSLLKKGSEPSRVLCLGAHSDDIEIGCGGTILSLKQSLPSLQFYWIVFSAAESRREEAARAAELFTAGCKHEVMFAGFRDGFLPYEGGQVKDYFESLKQKISPDLIFTHWQGDAHQDHRLLSELAWNTFRDHLILEYEIPKYDGDLGRPNCLVPLAKSVCEQKVDYLFEAFTSQRDKRWFDRETFLGLMRIRGMEANSESGYAEAFFGRKLVVRT